MFWCKAEGNCHVKIIEHLHLMIKRAVGAGAETVGPTQPVRSFFTPSSFRSLRQAPSGDLRNEPIDNTKIRRIKLELSNAGLQAGARP
jgi:hypothetical protein